MKTKILTLIAISAFVFLGQSCIDNTNQQIEKSIKSEIKSEVAAIASLEAIYVLVFDHFRKNRWYDPQSDNAYIEKNEARIDYGFRIDDDNIKVINVNGQKTLQVRLNPAKKLATDRFELSKDKTHQSYIPMNDDGSKIDISGELNKKLEEIEQKYLPDHIEKAGENIKNFFKIVATKYGLQLDFRIIK